MNDSKISLFVVYLSIGLFGCLGSLVCGAVAQKAIVSAPELQKGESKDVTPLELAKTDPSTWTAVLLRLDYREEAAKGCVGLMRIYLETTRSALQDPSVAEGYTIYRQSDVPLLRAIGEFASDSLGSDASERVLLSMLESKDACIRWLALRGLVDYFGRKFGDAGALAPIAEHPDLVNAALVLPRAVEIGATRDDIARIEVWGAFAKLQISGLNPSKNPIFLFERLNGSWRYVGELSWTTTVR